MQKNLKKMEQTSEKQPEKTKQFNQPNKELQSAETQPRQQ